MSTISSIINKTEFIKTCGIGSLIFTGSTAIIACISCYITFENYKLTIKNRKLIQQLLQDNNKMHNQFVFENTKNAEIVEPTLETEKIVKHEKDYLDTFEEYYDVVPDNTDNTENNGFSLYKLFRLM
jgi:hypothetical protein